MLKTSILILSVIATISGCGSVAAESETSTVPAVSAIAPKRDAKPAAATDPDGIHNLLKVSERIYSGSEPHGEEGFASLAKLSVKTVISVDGARPNLEMARRHGLRYVHIPIGYDGVSEEAGLSLARAAREVASPVYVHCHHGKHRGPAAAAVLCIAAGDVSNEDAHRILERAGTSKDYRGLWRDVKRFVAPGADAALPELVEVAEVGSFPAAMAHVDRAFDNLKLCRDAEWRVPPGHPDLLAGQEALLLVEGLHEAGRNLGDSYDEQFQKWLADAEMEAVNLRSDLEKKNSDSAGERLLSIEKTCKQCHQRYRDN